MQTQLSYPRSGYEPSPLINLNDQTVEGMRHRTKPIFCVQYHPEASPGPEDSHYLFSRFVNMMLENKGLKARPER